MASYTTLTVSQLKAVLNDRLIDYRGLTRKQQLIDRLEVSDRTPTESSGQAESAGVNAEPLEPQGLGTNAKNRAAAAPSRSSSQESGSQQPAETEDSLYNNPENEVDQELENQYAREANAQLLQDMQAAAGNEQAQDQVEIHYSLALLGRIRTNIINHPTMLTLVAIILMILCLQFFSDKPVVHDIKDLFTKSNTTTSVLSLPDCIASANHDFAELATAGRQMDESRKAGTPWSSHLEQLADVLEETRYPAEELVNELRLLSQGNTGAQDSLKNVSLQLHNMLSYQVKQMRYLVKSITPTAPASGQTTFYDWLPTRSYLFFKEHILSFWPFPSKGTLSIPQLYFIMMKEHYTAVQRAAQLRLRYHDLLWGITRNVHDSFDNSLPSLGPLPQAYQKALRKWYYRPKETPSMSNLWMPIVPIKELGDLTYEKAPAPWFWYFRSWLRYRQEERAKVAFVRKAVDVLHIKIPELLNASEKPVKTTIRVLNSVHNLLGEIQERCRQGEQKWGGLRIDEHELDEIRRSLIYLERMLKGWKGGRFQAKKDL